MLPQLSTLINYSNLSSNYIYIYIYATYGINYDDDDDDASKVILI